MSTYCTWIRKLVQNSPIWSSTENKLANLKTTSTFTSLSLNPSIYQSFRIRGAPSSNQQLVESKWGPKCVCCMLWNRIVQFGVQLVADLVCVWWCWRWWGRVWVYCKYYLQGILFIPPCEWSTLWVYLFTRICYHDKWWWVAFVDKLT